MPVTSKNPKKTSKSSTRAKSSEIQTVIELDDSIVELIKEAVAESKRNSDHTTLPYNEKSLSEENPD